jgi:hypothetical protein
MAGKLSRREWFLGLVGAVLGAGAAKLAGRWLPGGGRRTSSTWLIRAETAGPGTGRTSYTKVEGKVEVSPGPEPGTFVVAVHDGAGRLVEQSCRPLRFLYFYEELPPAPAADSPRGIGSYPGPHYAAVTHTYDASGRVTSVTESGYPVYSYSYTGRGTV